MLYQFIIMLILVKKRVPTKCEDYNLISWNNFLRMADRQQIPR